MWEEVITTDWRRWQINKRLITLYEVDWVWMFDDDAIDHEATKKLHKYYIRNSDWNLACRSKEEYDKLHKST